MRTLASRGAQVVGHAFARAAGVADPPIQWRYTQDPTFDNQVATLALDGRDAQLKIERALPGETAEPALEAALERRLV